MLLRSTVVGAMSVSRLTRSAGVDKWTYLFDLSTRLPFLCSGVPDQADTGDAHFCFFSGRNGPMLLASCRALFAAMSERAKHCVPCTRG